MLYKQDRKVAAALRSLMSQTRDSMVCFEFQEPVNPSEPQEIINSKLRDARVVEASNSFARYFGYEGRESIIGAHLMELFNHEIPEWFVDYGQEVEDGGFEDIERRIEIPVGDGWRSFRVYMQNIFEGPLLTSQWLTLRDITRQERQEREIEENKQLQNLALDAVGLKSFSIFVNKESDALSQLLEVLCDGESLGSIHPDDSDVVHQACLEFVKGESDTLHTLFRRIQPEDEELWIEVWGVASERTDFGLPKHIVGVYFDRTETKVLESRLITNQRLESLGVLAGGIAHDFNNLLMTIMASLDLVAHRQPEVSEQLRVVDDAATQAAQLCNQLLTYAGRGTGNLSTANVTEILSSMEDLLAVTVDSKIHLDVSLEDDCWVKCDASQIRQIALNLLRNSSDAIGGEAGKISLSLRQRDYEGAWQEAYELGEGLQPGRYVELVVHDNGSGMSMTERAKVFDPFYTTKFTGRGLGLAVVMGIVRGHSGAINIVTAPGEGCEVSILFPYDTAEKKPRRTDEAPVFSTLSGHVLVVDDEPSVLQTVGGLLSEIGLTSELVDSGQGAIAAIDKNPDAYAVVLMDVTMPDLDGVETAARILERFPSCNIVLSSGYTNVVLPEKLESMVDFLQKPYRLQQLYSALKPFSLIEER